MCACISLRADWARRALRAGGPSRHRACAARSTPAVPRQHPASTDYRNLRRRRARLSIFLIFTEAIHLYESIRGRPARFARKTSGYKRRLRRVLRRRELFFGRGSARRLGGARMRRLDGDACTAAQAQEWAREWAPVEYPSSTRRETPVVVRRTPPAVVWTGMPTWQREVATALRCNLTVRCTRELLRACACVRAWGADGVTVCACVGTGTLGTRGAGRSPPSGTSRRARRRRRTLRRSGLHCGAL
jgi:hypothetical protein